MQLPSRNGAKAALPKQLGSISVVCSIPPPLALIVAVPSSWSRWHPFQAGAERGRGGGGALQKERKSATAKIPAFPPTTFHRSRHLLGCSSKRLSHPSSSTSTRELNPTSFSAGESSFFSLCTIQQQKGSFQGAKKGGKAILKNPHLALYMVFANFSPSSSHGAAVAKNSLQKRAKLEKLFLLFFRAAPPSSRSLLSFISQEVLYSFLLRCPPSSAPLG